MFCGCFGNFLLSLFAKCVARAREKTHFSLIYVFNKRQAFCWLSSESRSFAFWNAKRRIPRRVWKTAYLYVGGFFYLDNNTQDRNCANNFIIYKVVGLFTMLFRGCFPSSWCPLCTVPFKQEFNFVTYMLAYLLLSALVEIAVLQQLYTFEMLILNETPTDLSVLQVFSNFFYFRTLPCAARFSFIL